MISYKQYSQGKPVKHDMLFKSINVVLFQHKCVSAVQARRPAGDPGQCYVKWTSENLRWCAVKHIYLSIRYREFPCTQTVDRFR